MDEPILPSVKAPRVRVLRPTSLAIVGATAVAISYMGIHAWRDRWIRTQEPPKLTILGSGSIELPADTIAMSLSIDVSGKKRDDVERMLRTKSAAVLDRLRANLDANGQILTDGLTIREDHEDADNGTGRVIGYSGSQAIDVRSKDIAHGRDAYHALEQMADPALSLTAPTCSLQNREALSVAQTRAWLDFRQQRGIAEQNTGVALGRVVDISKPVPSIEAVDDNWRCESGFIVKAAITVTYAL